MGSCLRISDKTIESPYIDYQRLNIDSLLDLWCSGEVNQIIWKFNKFCQTKGIKKLTPKELPQFFPLLRKYYPLQSFHKKIFSLLDHNNDKAINSREMLWGLTLVLKLEIKQLSQVLFSLYRTGNNHFLTQPEFKQFLGENTLLLDKNTPRFQVFQTVSFAEFTQFVKDNFDETIFRQIFDCTRSLEEIKIAESLKVSKGIIPLSRGDIVYVVDAKWFIEWKLYIQGRYSLPEIHFKEGDINISPKRRSTITTSDSILVNFLEERKERLATDKDKDTFKNTLHKPSKIDNSHLESFEFEGQLKEDLEIYQHFVFIPEILWVIFKQEYGGGPEFKVIYPNIQQLFFTQVLVNSKGKFIQGQRPKKLTLFNSRINNILNIIPSDTKLFAVYKRNIGQPLWTKISIQGTVAQQCISNNSFICKIPLQHQQQFINRYNQPLEQKSKINYAESIVMNDRYHQSAIGYVTEILDDKVKIHFKGKSYENDIVFDEDQFLKIAKSSKFEHESSSSYTGLSNLGNTCYMNSILQCLMSTPIFEDFLINQSYKQLLQQHKQSKQYPVIKQLSQLSKLCNPNNKYVRPSAFINLIKKTLIQFDNYEQHDAEEFFVSLLHQLSTELSIRKVSIGKVDSLDLLNSGLKEKYCMIEKFFGGVEKRVIKCEQCKNTTIKNEQFYSLGLPVPQLEYGYYFVVFYPSKYHNEFLPIQQYGAKLKKNAKFQEFMQVFSELIGKPEQVLNFAQVARSEFRKHFRQSHKTKTLLDLYIQSSDIIYVFQQKRLPSVNKRKYSEDKKKNFPKDLKKGALIDILYYTQYQVASFISYDEQRKKVKYQSLDIQHEIDQNLVSPFLSKTYYKPCYNIEVQHRKYNPTKKQFEYFLRPFMVSIPEWIKWSDVVDIINDQAMRFVDENYWQRVISSSLGVSPGEGEGTRKRNGSDSEIMRSRNHSLNVELMKVNQSEIKKQLKIEQQSNILFPDLENGKVPYRISVLNRSNEMCAICNKRVKSRLSTQQSQQNKFLMFRECKGCQYNNDLPISLIFDIKRIMFVLDWQKTLAVNPDSNKIQPHPSCQKTQALKHSDRFKIQDCLKLYANIQQNIEVTCEKCKHTESSLQCLVSKTPNMLVIHLKRFKYTNGYFSKIQSPIECPLVISLEKITTDKSSSKYELYGIVCHMGSGFGGHYYCYVRKGRNKWVLCDDHLTKPVEDIFKEVNLKHVYLLMFKKVEVDGSLLTLSL